MTCEVQLFYVGSARVLHLDALANSICASAAVGDHYLIIIIVIGSFC